MRKTISSVADCAAPASAEPATNSAIETSYSRLVPNRSAAQPVSGMTVARASM
jgi:hypothetical protein